MRKPLPVKIAEALGWVYVALASLLLVSTVVSTVCAGIGRGDEWFPALSCLFPLALSVGMVLSLRRGFRMLSLLAHVVVTVAAALWAVPLLGGMMVGSLAVFLVLLAAPIILLRHPLSGLWFRERLGGKAEPKCVFYIVVAALLVIAVTVVAAAVGLYWRGMAHAKSIPITVQGRNLFVLMARNEQGREGGQDWVDPAAYTNPTQFVQALCEKYKEDAGGRLGDPGLHSDIWCIAVNPPEDDSFPLLFTCNIEPRELLCPQDEDRPLKLTCPKAWGGPCFSFCEKAAVIVRVGGASHLCNARYARHKLIFRDGIPKPGPDTYFMTPTGRVDLVEGRDAGTSRKQ